VLAEVVEEAVLVEGVVEEVLLVEGLIEEVVVIEVLVQKVMVAAAVNKVGSLELANPIYIQAVRCAHLKLSILWHGPVWSMLIGTNNMEKQNVARLY
jgi:hypothetical protein